MGAHVLDQAGGLTGSVVLLRDLAVLEDLQRGIALDGELAARLLAGLGAVDFGEGDRRIVAAEELSSTGEFRFEFLAVAAPGGGGERVVLWTRQRNNGGGGDGCCV